MSLTAQEIKKMRLSGRKRQLVERWRTIVTKLEIFLKLSGQEIAVIRWAKNRKREDSPSVIMTGSNIVTNALVKNMPQLLADMEHFSGKDIDPKHLTAKAKHAMKDHSAKSLRSDEESPTRSLLARVQDESKSVTKGTGQTSILKKTSSDKDMSSSTTLTGEQERAVSESGPIQLVDKHNNEYKIEYLDDGDEEGCDDFNDDDIDDDFEDGDDNVNMKVLNSFKISETDHEYSKTAPCAIVPIKRLAKLSDMLIDLEKTETAPFLSDHKKQAQSNQDASVIKGKSQENSTFQGPNTVFLKPVIQPAGAIGGPQSTGIQFVTTPMSGATQLSTSAVQPTGANKYVILPPPQSIGAPQSTGIRLVTTPISGATQLSTNAVQPTGANKYVILPPPQSIGAPQSTGIRLVTTPISGATQLSTSVEKPTGANKYVILPPPKSISGPQSSNIRFVTKPIPASWATQLRSSAVQPRGVKRTIIWPPPQSTGGPQSTGVGLVATPISGATQLSSSAVQPTGANKYVILPPPQSIGGPQSTGIRFVTTPISGATQLSSSAVQPTGANKYVILPPQPIGGPQPTDVQPTGAKRTIIWPPKSIGGPQSAGIRFVAAPISGSTQLSTTALQPTGIIQSTPKPTGEAQSNATGVFSSLILGDTQISTKSVQPTDLKKSNTLSSPINPNVGHQTVVTRFVTPPIKEATDSSTTPLQHAGTIEPGSMTSTFIDGIEYKVPVTTPNASPGFVRAIVVPGSAVAKPVSEKAPQRIAASPYPTAVTKSATWSSPMSTSLLKPTYRSSRKPRHKSRNKVVHITKVTKPVTKSAAVTSRFSSHPIAIRPKPSAEGPLEECPQKGCFKVFIDKKELTKHVEIEEKKELKFKCGECDRMFATENGKRLHEVQHEEHPYSCEICPKKFREESYLFAHQVVHDRTDSTTCKYCDKEFKNLPDLRQHIVCHARRTVECTQCPSKFRCRADLKLHMLVHADNMPYCCDQCGRQFRKEDRFRVHYRSAHLGIMPYVCDTCGRKFPCRAYLTSHQKCHLDMKDRVHKCHCDKRFNDRKNLRSHQKVCYMTPEDTAKGLNLISLRRLRCKYCKQRFASEKLKFAHIKENQADGIHVYKWRKFWCDECDAIFTTIIERCEHQKTHITEGGEEHSCKHCRNERFSYLCDSCPRKYTTQKARCRHMKVHEKEGKDPHSCDGCEKRVHNTAKCDLCARRFKSQIEKCMHMKKKHTKEGEEEHSCDHCYNVKKALTKKQLRKKNTVKTFPCKICNIYYVHIPDLVEHVQQHHVSPNGSKWNKPTVCARCGSFFSKYSNYSIHLRKHTGENMQACRICEKLFVTRVSRNRHEATHTNLRPHACEHCGSKFKTVFGVKKHVNSVHLKRRPTQTTAARTKSRVVIDSTNVSTPGHAANRSYDVMQVDTEDAVTQVLYEISSLNRS